MILFSLFLFISLFLVIDFDAFATEASVSPAVIRLSVERMPVAAMSPLAHVMAFLLRSILHVFGASAYEQMVRVKTRRIIATMAYVESAIEIKTKPYMCSESMGLNVSSLKPNERIGFGIRVAPECPAPRLLVDNNPLQNWDSLWHKVIFAFSSARDNRTGVLLCPEA